MEALKLMPYADITAMVLGAIIGFVGLCLVAFTRDRREKSHIKAFGMEVQVSTTGLVVLVIGVGLTGSTAYFSKTDVPSTALKAKIDRLQSDILSIQLNLAQIRTDDIVYSNFLEDKLSATKTDTITEIVDRKLHNFLAVSYGFSTNLSLSDDKNKFTTYLFVPANHTLLVACEILALDWRESLAHKKNRPALQLRVEDQVRLVQLKPERNTVRIFLKKSYSIKTFRSSASESDTSVTSVAQGLRSPDSAGLQKLEIQIAGSTEIPLVVAHEQWPFSYDTQCVVFIRGNGDVSSPNLEEYLIAWSR